MIQEHSVSGAPIHVHKLACSPKMDQKSKLEIKLIERRFDELYARSPTPTVSPESIDERAEK